MNALLCKKNIVDKFFLKKMTVLLPLLLGSITFRNNNIVLVSFLLIFTDFQISSALPNNFKVACQQR